MLVEDLHIVLKVAEFQSITGAATSLDIRTATASAALKRVEKALGAELFIRTTRRLRLSGAGERYLPKCQDALRLLEQARLNIHEEGDVLEGELRLSVSSDLGRNLITPWLDDFMDSHPGLRLRLHLSDSTIDFYRDPIDVAIRYGSPGEANLYGFKLCDSPALLCASKDYIAKHGAPRHPNELHAHNGLFYQLHDLTHNHWVFQQGGAEYKIRMNSNRISNDGDQVRRWCIAGKGLAVKSSIEVTEDLLCGKLVSLMPGYYHSPVELWLIVPSRQSITPVIRVLRDHLIDKCNNTLNKLQEKGIIKYPARSPDQMS
ncbi:MAG: LysR substrate-binding domain-containing protein [Pseudomonadota bacterium]